MIHCLCIELTNSPDIGVAKFLCDGSTSTGTNKGGALVIWGTKCRLGCWVLKCNKSFECCLHFICGCHLCFPLTNATTLAGCFSFVFCSLLFRLFLNHLHVHRRLLLLILVSWRTNSCISRLLSSTFDFGFHNFLSNFFHVHVLFLSLNVLNVPWYFSLLFMCLAHLICMLSFWMQCTPITWSPSSKLFWGGTTLVSFSHLFCNFERPTAAATNSRSCGAKKGSFDSRKTMQG